MAQAYIVEDEKNFALARGRGRQRSDASNCVRAESRVRCQGRGAEGSCSGARNARNSTSKYHFDEAVDVAIDNLRV